MERILIAINICLCFLAVGFVGCGEDETILGSDADRLISEGWQEYGAGNYEDAIVKCQQALDLEEDAASSEAYNGTGWARARLGQTLDSIDNFKKAVAKDPANADAHAGLAGMYFADDDYERSIASANLVLSLNPDYESHHDSIKATDIRILLAECYYYIGEYSDAEEQIELLGVSCKDLDPSSPSYTADLLSHIRELVKRGSLQISNG